MVEIISLPAEVIIKIVEHLPLVSVPRVCKSSSVISSICKDEFLWKRRFQKDFSQMYVPDENCWLPSYIMVKQSFVELPITLITVTTRTGSPIVGLPNPLDMKINYESVTKFMYSSFFHLASDNIPKDLTGHFNQHDILVYHNKAIEPVIIQIPCAQVTQLNPRVKDGEISGAMVVKWDSLTKVVLKDFLIKEPLGMTGYKTLPASSMVRVLNVVSSYLPRPLTPGELNFHLLAGTLIPQWSVYGVIPLF